MSQKCSKILFIFLAVFYIIPLVLYILHHNVKTESTEEIEPEPTPVFEYDSDLIYVTAAHINHNSFEGYTRIYYDTDLDRAVYIKDDYTPKLDIPLGSTLYMGDTPATLMEMFTDGFIIQIEPLVEHGMSGSRVTYEGIPIGYVSKAEGLHEILCRYL